MAIKTWALSLIFMFLVSAQEVSYLQSLIEQWNSISDKLSHVKSQTQECHKAIEELDREVSEANVYLDAFLRGDVVNYGELELAKWLQEIVDKGKKALKGCFPAVAKGGKV